MNPYNITAFLSYSRDDDRNNDNIISNLMKILETKMNKIDGVKFTYFQDKETTRTGDNWPEIINGYLDKSDVFIAFLTPKYFSSTYCLDELRKFHKNITPSKFIFPIYFEEADLILNPITFGKDDTAKILSNYLYTDWTDIGQKKANKYMKRKKN